jgi:hypothetical protein
MRKALALIALLALPTLARAGEIEVTGLAGYTFPFYSQKFNYSPGQVSIPIPGVSVTQSGAFELKGSGGPAFAGSLAFFPADALGVEVRLDHASLKLETQGGGYDVNLALPAPLDPVKTTLDLGPGEATLDAAGPLSLNVKLRTTGRSKLYVSGGLSRLGELNVSLKQTVALGVVAVNLVTNHLEIATIEMRTKLPAQSGSRWGGSAWGCSSRWASTAAWCWRGAASSSRSASTTGRPSSRRRCHRCSRSCWIACNSTRSK